MIRVGHRGAAALAPENTLRSFEAALALGVDAIEFDVLALADGPLVLGHSLAELAPDEPSRRSDDGARRSSPRPRRRRSTST